MLTDGELLESDLAWCESLDGWVPLSSLISRPGRIEGDSGIMPDSLAASAGAAIALALLHKHYSKADHVESEPTNIAPIDDAENDLEIPYDDGGQPPILRAAPPPLTEETLEPIENEVAEPSEEAEVFARDETEPEITSDLDVDFDLPDIDIDFDF
jgi:hypothetical protein